MAQDFNNIPAGLNVPTQIPLNIKENVLNEATLAYLGLSNNLAYTYHDQMIVTCLEEGTRYIWREVLVGEENTGLIPLDFTYPSNIVVYGVIYSNRKFNFFKLPSLEKEYSIANIGTGENIYKSPDIIIGNNTQFNLKKLNSSSLNITTSLDGNTINIETLDSGIRRFIVNSDYTGLIEEGTVSRPFKNLQNALDAYVGNGVSNKAPEFLGALIIIQKDINVFTGSLSYKGLKLLIEESARLDLNPSLLTGDYSLNLDSEATFETNINYSMLSFANNEAIDVNIESRGLVIVRKKFLKNRGTNLNTSNHIGKRLSFKGNIIITDDVSVILPSTRNIFSLNEDNQPGFFNDGNMSHLYFEGNIQSNTSQVLFSGKNAISDFVNSDIFFGNTGAFNSNTIPIEIKDSYVNITNTNLINKYNNPPLYSLVNYISILGTSTLNISNSKTDGDVESMFICKDIGSSTSSVVVLNNIISSGTSVEYFKSDLSSGVWNVTLNNCNLSSWGVDDTKVKIIPGAINSINGQIVETLNQYNNRASAIIAGLFSGCKFINTGGVVSPTTGWFVDIVI